MLDANLSRWLEAHAEPLDRGEHDAENVLPQLAASGLLGLGVSESLGGAGGTTLDAVDAVAEVATYSLTSAFVLWGQRSFIEYLLVSDNTGLRERLLGDLLAGRVAGATGLSNAMKFLSGIEQLGVSAEEEQNGWRLNGRMPWVTNLRKGGYVVAAAIDLPGREPFIAALPDELTGLQRSDDLQLIGMQSSNTAALDVRDVQLDRDWLLGQDARTYLGKVRPAFLGLQCGMSIGLARRALAEARRNLDFRRSVLEDEFQRVSDQLASAEAQLKQGLSDGRFVGQPAAMFHVRIALAESVADAIQLELQTSGGKAYLQAHGEGFARRLRESAFVPVITPSLVQLKTELQRLANA